MAIYSLNHKAVGKATQERDFTAAAHVKYITRDSACREVLGNRMPVDSRKAQQWLKAEESADRKNARVCDKVMIALPRELDQEQRTELVRDFAERVTQGKAPWLAAIHDKGKDRQNPHCHMVFRDRDTSTGKRCLHMSAGKSERALLAEKGIDAMTTDRMRAMWEHAANEHLERAGHNARIDRRTLEAQCIQRKPTLHEGVQARQMTARGERPTSKVVDFPNAPTARTERRTVDYTAIDEGKTRQEHNAAIIALSERRKNSFAKNPKLADNFGDERRHSSPPEDPPTRNRRDPGNHSNQRDFHPGTGRTSGAGEQPSQGDRPRDIAQPNSLRQVVVSTRPGQQSRTADIGHAGSGARHAMQENFDEEMKKARTPAQRAAISQKYWEQAEEVRLSNGVQRKTGSISEEEQKRVYELCDRLQKRAHTELAKSDEGRAYLSKGMGEAKERLNKEYSRTFWDKGIDEKPDAPMRAARGEWEQERKEQAEKDFNAQSAPENDGWLKAQMEKLRAKNKQKRLEQEKGKDRGMDLDM